MLVPAKSLVRLPGIRRMRGRKEIRWWHFACDDHGIVTANGAQAENLLLGKMVFKALLKEDRDELLMQYGTDRAHEGALNGKAVRMCIGSGKVARILNGTAKVSSFICPNRNFPEIGKDGLEACSKLSLFDVPRLEHAEL